MPIVVSTATQAHANSKRVKMRSTTLRATKSARTRRQLASLGAGAPR